MADEEQKAPAGDSGDDTDERFQDHPEMAPDESRISVERVKHLREQAMRRGTDAGEPSEGAQRSELSFKRNNDLAGDEASQPTDADYTRGSGWLGEDPDNRERHTSDADPGTVANEGFPLSAKQLKNAEAARREQERAAQGGYAAGETGISETASGPSAASSSSDLEGDIEDQGRDLGKGPQVTGTQRFGRDVGSQGLSQEDAEGEEGARHSAGHAPHRDWTAVLGRLGGSSPGSQENLALAEKFGSVQFPTNRDEVLKRLDPVAEFHFRVGSASSPGITVDLRHAVSSSRNDSFRNMNDLIDCVKDELRRAEKPVV